MPSGTHPTYVHCYKVHMLGLPTWEGGIFICKSISGAHDDMTYFTFYKQSPERNVLHPRWKPYPLWRSRAPGPWLGTTPRWQRSPIINQVTPGFCKNQLGFETKGRSSPRRPPRHFLTLEPAKINPGVETRIRKILFKQLWRSWRHTSPGRAWGRHVDTRA